MKTKVSSKGRLVTAVAFIFAIFLILNSCTKSMNNMYGMGGGGGNGGDKGGPGINEVWIQGMAFNPSSITVSAGTIITWTNKDGISHTVTSDTGTFDSGNIGINATYSQNFATKGTFIYHCSFHPSMVAKVIVN